MTFFVRGETDWTKAKVFLLCAARGYYPVPTSPFFLLDDVFPFIFHDRKDVHPSSCMYIILLELYEAICSQHNGPRNVEK